jgi:alpha-tubulin suppressor-like RCC1 family protein
VEKIDNTPISSELYMWGDNRHGQLGLDDTDPRFIPTLIPHPESLNWKYVNMGVNDHSFAIDENDQL